MAQRALIAVKCIVQACQGQVRARPFRHVGGVGIICTVSGEDIVLRGAWAFLLQCERTFPVASEALSRTRSQSH